MLALFVGSTFRTTTGALSSGIFLHCGTLFWLDLSSNSLSDSLPSGISQCTSLQHLDLSFNPFNKDGRNRRTDDSPLLDDSAGQNEAFS